MNLMRGIDLKKVAAAINGASGAEAKVRLRTSVSICLFREDPGLRSWSLVEAVSVNGE